MNLAQAVKGVNLIAFDTAPLIYFVERHPDYFDRLLYLMSAVDKGQLEGVTSTITLTEVLVQPIRTANQTLASRYEAVLTNSRHFQVEAITTKTARLAAELRAQYNLKTPDALQVASAIQANADAFLTNDKGLRRVTEVAVWVVEELELPPSN
jgi:predicted nucleic acid-binding protein